MKKPLVTILSPVYNGENYISRFLDSILDQNYNNIELILVNDGSTDNTDKVVESYSEKLKKQITSFKYIKQENMGAAGAINTGLKHVTGEYITWPDSDDMLTIDSISMKVEFLEKNIDYGYVRTEALAFKESDLSKPLYKIRRKDGKNDKTDLFYEFLFDKNIYYCDGCYMARTSSLKKCLSDMKIYVTKWGQNWQLLLPLSYNEKCGYINKVGYYYFERDNSHSHNQKKYQDFLNKYNGYEDIIINVLNSMKIKEYNNLKKIININYTHLRLELAVKYNMISDFNKEFKFLKNNKNLNFKEKIYGLVRNKILIQKLFAFFSYLIEIPTKAKNKIVKVVKKNERF